MSLRFSESKKAIVKAVYLSSAVVTSGKTLLPKFLRLVIDQSNIPYEKSGTAAQRYDYS